MNRARVLAELTGCASGVRARGVRALYLFGSTARDLVRNSSDVDIFIESDPTTRFNAFDLIDVKLLLEKRLVANVNLTTREGLHPLLREQIELEAIRVF